MDVIMIKIMMNSEVLLHLSLFLRQRLRHICLYPQIHSIFKSFITPLHQSDAPSSRHWSKKQQIYKMMQIFTYISSVSLIILNSLVYQGLSVFGKLIFLCIIIFHSSFAFFELIGIDKITRVVFLETHWILWHI